MLQSNTIQTASPKRGWLIAGATAALALAAMAFSSGAQARSDVQFSVGVVLPGAQIGVSNAYPVYSPPVYVQPQPVYYQQPPLYYQPPPVYRPRPVYYERPPMYVVPAPVYYRGGYGYGRHHGYRHQGHGGHRGHGGHGGHGH